MYYNEYDEDFWKALDNLIDNSEIVIDRPKGTLHPKYPDFIYQVDYGYLKSTSSMDGSGIDVWVGSGEKRIVAIMCTVDLMKKDSEIKILIGCTEEEMMKVRNLGKKSFDEVREKLQSLGFDLSSEED